LTTDHQRRVRELFDAALDQHSSDRLQFLADACQGDQQLFKTVEKLLRANERSAGVLDTPVRQRREDTFGPRAPGSQIGPYKILQELSGGGMGIVYQALRADEVFQRICAIKVIRSEVATDWLVERFRQERQILARLDHVNIARIVDGGTTAEGLPYFVMDYVDGPTINRFCAQHVLSYRPRLALFQQACAAVQYLHKNGVIHGDLKPPNILVGNDGFVKLVDFGIASVLSGSSAAGQNISLPLMTPGYASPEQMRGEPLAPTSDVYSLGVILYELLAGTQPFPLGSRSDLLNAVATQDPTPPSIAARTAPHSGDGHDPSAHKLTHDLDCIVLRAMHRDPERRYPSVAELSADISRYQQGLPVTARKSGFLYKGTKLLLRHRTAVLAALMIAILTAVTSWEALELHKRYALALQLQNQVSALEQQLVEEAKNRGIQLPIPSSTTGKPLNPGQMPERQLLGVRKLADAYQNDFSESVRLWPGMTGKRRDLLDRTDRYLREAEPFVSQDPAASRQLASAWLALANLEGNPQTVNLNDRAGAAASISEAQRLLEKFPNSSHGLMGQVQDAAREIEAARR
jgi:eukaryotic-like serine/threonine-protein kinase